MDRNEFWAVTGGESTPEIRTAIKLRGKKTSKKERFGFFVLAVLSVFVLELITNWSFR